MSPDPNEVADTFGEDYAVDLVDEPEAVTDEQIAKAVKDSEDG